MKNLVHLLLVFSLYYLVFSSSGIIGPIFGDPNLTSHYSQYADVSYFTIGAWVACDIIGNLVKRLFERVD